MNKIVYYYYHKGSNKFLANKIADDLSTQTHQGRGLSFCANEKTMYITGRNEERIFQYELKCK